MLRLSLRCVGVLGLFWLGCGGGDGGGSGVGSSTKLSSATAADLTSLCDSHKSDLLGLASSACVVDGLGENTQAACETRRSACAADPKQNPSIDCSMPKTSDLQGCDVTVGEFESCLTTLVNYFKPLSCADVGKTPPDPPACFSTLMGKCKSLFSGSSSSTSTSSGSAGTGH